MVSAIRVAYGPVVAVDGIDLEVREGRSVAEKTTESAEKIAGLLLVVGGILIVVEKELGL